LFQEKKGKREAHQVLLELFHLQKVEKDFLKDQILNLMEKDQDQKEEMKKQIMKLLQI